MQVIKQEGSWAHHIATHTERVKSLRRLWTIRRNYKLPSRPVTTSAVEVAAATPTAVSCSPAAAAKAKYPQSKNVFLCRGHGEVHEIKEPTRALFRHILDPR